MSAKNDPQPDQSSEQTPMNQGNSNFDFETWSSQVRRQMLHSLKKRTVVYGDFWGNNARANPAKAEEQKEKPDV
jgi:hypothetical protein